MGVVMKIVDFVRSVFPYRLVKKTHKRKTTRIPFEQFQRRFGEVAKLLEDNKRFKCSWEDRWPCLDDLSEGTPFDAHYIYHTAWAARLLTQTRPSLHIDIGSSLYFVSMMSAVVPIDFYDYRPADMRLDNLACKRADVCDLPFSDSSVSSLSCMHVVEHIGLERYGDPFAPQGDLRAMDELCRVLEPGGQLFFVVPVGGEALIQYNAHRIYTYSSVMSYFETLVLKDFALVCDDRRYIQKATEADVQQQRYGCGCFHFVKPSS